MISAYLTDTVTIKTVTRTATGRLSTTSSASVKGRMEFTRRSMRNDEGAETIARASLYLKPDQAVSLGQEVVYNGESFTVAEIQVVNDWIARFKLVLLT